MADMSNIQGVLDRLNKGYGPDRDLDWDIAKALGGSIRKVTRLGLNGRTPGSWRVFWPDKPDNGGRGSVIPSYTKQRDKTKAKLIAAVDEATHD